MQPAGQKCAPAGLAVSLPLFPNPPSSGGYSAARLAAAREAEKGGFELVLLQPDSTGTIPEQAIYEAVNQNTIFVSMQLINNEVGAVQPVDVLARAVKRAKAPARRSSRQNSSGKGRAWDMTWLSPPSETRRSP